MNAETEDASFDGRLKAMFDAVRPVDHGGAFLRRLERALRREAMTRRIVIWAAALIGAGLAALQIGPGAELIGLAVHAVSDVGAAVGGRIQDTSGGAAAWAAAETRVPWALSLGSAMILCGLAWAAGRGVMR